MPMTHETKQRLKDRLIFFLHLAIIVTALTIITVAIVRYAKREQERINQAMNNGKTEIGGTFIIEETHMTNSSRYSTVYDKNTNVKYIIIYTDRGVGISPLYNSDGTLQLHTSDK